MSYKYPEGNSLMQSFFNTFSMVRRPIEVIEGSISKFGDTYSAYTGSVLKSIITQDPQFIEHVLKKNHKNYSKSDIVSKKVAHFLGNGLLTSNGSYWLRQRRLIQPGFHPQKIQALYAIMDKTVAQFLDKFPTGTAVDMYPLMNSLAFEIVINTLFNVPIPDDTRREIQDIISDVQSFIIRDIRQPYKSPWYDVSGIRRKYLGRTMKMRATIMEFVATRRAQGSRKDDLLDMLLDARYEDTGLPMDDQQILDEIMILIIAGHETTANALSWALYLLATHPEVLAKLCDATRGCSVQEIVANRYLAAVIEETMRLFPPAWVSDRVALDDDSFKGFSFPKGTMVILFYYGLHRNPQYWSNPSAFMPERFVNSEGDRTVKAYFPFGGGPRLCIGNNFAMAEMALFLKSFVHRFNVLPTAHKPAMLPLITLRPDNVILSVTKKT